MTDPTTEEITAIEAVETQLVAGRIDQIKREHPENRQPRRNRTDDEEPEE